MNRQRVVGIFVLALAVFGFSIYFSAKKMKDLRTEKMVDGGLPPSSSGSPSGSPNPTDSPVVVEQPKPGEGVSATEPKLNIVLPGPDCHPIAEFAMVKRELGRLVNNHELRQHKPAEFLKQVNEFRKNKGIPLPLTVDPTKLDPLNVVYNKCHPSCRGNVADVFVSRFISHVVTGRHIEVLTKDGKLKKLPLRDSGVETMTIDELNAKGVPFRSWTVPVWDSGWYIDGNNLYFPLDIEGVYLEASPQGGWTLANKPKSLSRLVEVEPAVKLAGCKPEDHCLQIEGAQGRHFSSPKACEAILKHSQDEPVEEPAPSPGNANSAPAGGKGSEL